MSKFKPGQSGNPNGRPSGSTSAITKAKTIICDVFLENEAKFKEQLSKACRINPMMYYLKFMLPFMPKNIELSGELGLDVNNQSTPGGVMSEIERLKKQLSGRTGNGRESAKKGPDKPRGRKKSS
jgi:hypothetical protein